jgi:hypothetical protein
MSQETLKKAFKVSSSTDTNLATVTTQIIQSNTQQLNDESVTIEIK